MQSFLVFGLAVLDSLNIAKEWKESRFLYAIKTGSLWCLSKGPSRDQNIPLHDLPPHGNSEHTQLAYLARLTLLPVQDIHLSAEALDFCALEHLLCIKYLCSLPCIANSIVTGVLWLFLQVSPASQYPKRSGSLRMHLLQRQVAVGFCSLYRD